MGTRESGKGQDRVQISRTARELAGTVEARSAESRELDSALERRILDRIADGYYERVDVRKELMRRLAPHLGMNT